MNPARELKKIADMLEPKKALVGEDDSFTEHEKQSLGQLFLEDRIRFNELEKPLEAVLRFVIFNSKNKLDWNAIWEKIRQDKDYKKELELFINPR